MLNRALACLATLVVSAFVLSLPAIARGPAPTNAKLDELMRRSGLWKQLPTLGPEIKAGFVQYQRDKPTDRHQLPPEQFAAITAAMDEAYSAGKLRTRTRAALAKLLSAEDVDAALAWLASDVGRAFTRLEEDASLASPTAALRAQAEQHNRLQSPERRARVERFCLATGAGRVGAEVVIQMMISAEQAFALAAPGAPQLSQVREARRKLESQRPALVREGAESCLETLSYVYRSTSDADLDRYIDFVESPGGLRYGDATAEALIQALNAGTEDWVNATIRSAKDSRKAP